MGELLPVNLCYLTPLHLIRELWTPPFEETRHDLTKMLFMSFFYSVSLCNFSLTIIMQSYCETDRGSHCGRKIVTTLRIIWGKRKGKNNIKQAQLGVPHSRIQVELGFILQNGTWQILNFSQNPRQKTESKCSRHRTKLGGDTAQKKCILGGGDTAHTFLI